MSSPGPQGTPNTRNSRQGKGRTGYTAHLPSMRKGQQGRSRRGGPEQPPFPGRPSPPLAPGREAYQAMPSTSRGVARTLCPTQQWLHPARQANPAPRRTSSCRTARARTRVHGGVGVQQQGQPGQTRFVFRETDSKGIGPAHGRAPPTPDKVGYLPHAEPIPFRAIAQPFATGAGRGEHHGQLPAAEGPAWLGPWPESPTGPGHSSAIRRNGAEPGNSW